MDSRYEGERKTASLIAVCMSVKTAASDKC